MVTPPSSCVVATQTDGVPHQQTLPNASCRKSRSTGVQAIWTARRCQASQTSGRVHPVSDNYKDDCANK
eukprot:11709233-Prorocentrum_lima.AAC.1